MTKEDCEALRRDIKVIADKLWAMRIEGGMPGEKQANATIAYRHLEDASMRLGKCIQAIDGGASVHDRTQVPGA